MQILKVINRVLVLGLIVFCIAFGAPFLSIATSGFVMEMVGCLPAEFEAYFCYENSFISTHFAPLAQPFTSWAAPVVFIQQFWGSVLLWLVLITISANLAKTDEDARPVTINLSKTEEITPIVRDVLLLCNILFWKSIKNLPKFYPVMAWMVFSTLLLGFITFVIVFGVPLLGTGISRHLVIEAGCTPGAGFSPYSCPKHSIIGERFGPYTEFIGSLATPILLFVQFWDVMLVWIILIIAFLCIAIRLGVKASKRKQEKK